MGIRFEKRCGKYVKVAYDDATGEAIGEPQESTETTVPDAGEPAPPEPVHKKPKKTKKHTE